MYTPCGGTFFLNERQTVWKRCLNVHAVYGHMEKRSAHMLSSISPPPLRFPLPPSHHFSLAVLLSVSVFLPASLSPVISPAPPRPHSLHRVHTCTSIACYHLDRESFCCSQHRSNSCGLAPVVGRLYSGNPNIAASRLLCMGTLNTGAELQKKLKAEKTLMSTAQLFFLFTHSQ